VFTRSGLDLSEQWSRVAHLCEMDDEVRRLERASRSGDPEARERYLTALKRTGQNGAALKHLIDAHRDHLRGWDAAEDDAAREHHAKAMFAARSAAHEFAERHGLHLADHISREDGESPYKFLTRAVHLHGGHGTSFSPHIGDTEHKGGAVTFTRWHDRVRDANKKWLPPRERPHAATASAFANMWKRETGAPASVRTMNGIFGEGSVAYLQAPTEG
jgi:hypothetical protein